MLELGREAPTLCEGWNVLDLAAHLVSRERDLWAGPGLIWGGPFARAMDLARERRRRRGLDQLVGTIRTGPPRLWKVLPAGAALSEYFIHHEDVRRANGRGARHDRELDEALARLLRASAHLLLRRIPTGTDLVWNGGVLCRHGAKPRAVLSGPPGELFLFLSGRRSAAEVELAGDTEAVERLRAEDLRL